ncbi:tetratricopeptide repeat protein [Streptomyces alanosinicus]|uniref:Tetratricopeptide repeat protein n=1 Tax=Streptomyces alanosinicus TaxID=68171 RepID=A0A918YIA2_9ACTN|nr:hypothetical protein [Streptomyces alanosinicus]GHE04919.1 hypothetical protein GCM10010339_38460 [Streptomyces alanosinicus]
MLLLTTPGGQAWRVPVLREAARVAEEHSDLSAAGAYLRRALAEPPPDTDRPGLLARLGVAEVHSDPEAAATHLRTVLAGEADVRVRATLVPHLAEALVRTGRAEAAVALLDELAGQFGEDDRETLYRLWAQGILVLLEETPHVADAWIARGHIARDLAGASPGQRLLLAALALKTTLSGQCAHAAADFADRARPARTDGGPRAHDRVRGGRAAARGPPHRRPLLRPAPRRRHPPPARPRAVPLPGDARQDRPPHG